MKQARFAGAVGGHIAVVVQMVAGEVGEHRRGKGHAVDAKLIQPVAGDFHRHHLRALGAVLGQLVLHGHRSGVVWVAAVSWPIKPLPTVPSSSAA